MEPKNRLKYIREKNNLTIGQLSKITGVSCSSINRQENLIRAITIKTALIYCDYFNCSLDYLFYRDTDTAEQQKQALLEILEELENKTSKKEA